MLLEGRSIVVTGGNTGIGKAIVLAAAAEGANVIVDYIMHPEYTAEVIAAAGRAGGCAVGVEADVSCTEDLRRDADGADPFLGIDHTAIAVSDPASSIRFFRNVFGFSVGTRTENRGPEQADLDDVDDVHVSVTRLAPDLPAPRLELLHYHVGTRRPIPHDTASNDIAATHTVVQVASLDATGAALARHGTPLTDDDIVILHEGTRAALAPGPEGHRFLVEEAGGG